MVSKLVLCLAVSLAVALTTAPLAAAAPLYSCISTCTIRAPGPYATVYDTIEDVVRETFCSLKTSSPQRYRDVLGEHQLSETELVRIAAHMAVEQDVGVVGLLAELGRPGGVESTCLAVRSTDSLVTQKSVSEIAKDMKRSTSRTVYPSAISMEASRLAAISVLIVRESSR